MQNIVIDISKRGVIPPIIVTEYDSMSRFFELRLLNNGADYTPPENANYSVWYETNDSKGWYDTITLPDETSRPAVVEDGNVLTVEIAEAATTSCGELAVMVTGDGGYQLTVAGIRLASADVPGYDGAEVEDYYNVYIADMQKNAARAENAAQTAIEYGATIDVDEAEEELIIDHYDDAGEVETWATVSEAWAVGKRNGVDVPSTDETYHNNSKYYAGQAGTAASEAAGNASQAANSAQSANSSAIDADAAKTAAQTAAETAAASASNAANSATAAASSATEAAASATQAASSAASAETAKTAAMDAAQDAIDAAQELQTAIQFNAALIHETASGAVASFADGADNIPMQSLVAEITPVQSGSGDPSPTNIRPISGRTGLTVTRAGENLFVPLNARNTTAIGVNVVSDGNGTITMTGTATGNDYVSLLFPSSFIIPDGAIFKFCLLNTQASSESIFRFVNGSTIVDSWAPNVVNREMNYSGMSGKEVTGVRIYITNGTTYNMTMQPMLVPKTVSVNGYIPYAGQTYPVTWESSAGTVYGGTLDVVSGVLTVDVAYAEFDGSDDEKWTWSANNNLSFINVSGGVVTNAVTQFKKYVQSNIFKGASWADRSDTGTVCMYYGASNICVKYSDFTSVADLKAYIAEHPLQVIYKLATPQTYQLTPTEVRTILGENQIYSDAGDVSVEYIADTKMYIDNKIAELQALVLENN